MLMIALASFAELVLHRTATVEAVVVADKYVPYIGFLSAHHMLFLHYL